MMLCLGGLLAMVRGAKGDEHLVKYDNNREETCGWFRVILC